MSISVIIPHYNSVETLKKLIESIPCGIGVQIVIVDDNSPPEVEEGLNDLKNYYYNRNIMVIKNFSKNSGAGACRNIGIDIAEGEWILFADADDFFVKDAFSHIQNYITSTKEVVFFKPTSLDIETYTVSDRHEAYEKLIESNIKLKSRESELYLRYTFFVPWSKLIKTNFIKRNNIYFDEIIASNDIMFSTKVGHYMNEFSVSDKIIYCVTRSKGSLTVNTSEFIFDARLQAHIDYVVFLKNHLNRQELQYFNLRGTGFVLNSLKYNLGIIKLLQTYKKLNKSNIKVLDFKYFNPIYLYKRLKYQKFSHEQTKKYYK